MLFKKNVSNLCSHFCLISASWGKKKKSWKSHRLKRSFLYDIQAEASYIQSVFWVQTGRAPCEHRPWCVTVRLPWWHVLMPFGFSTRLRGGEEETVISLWALTVIFQLWAQLKMDGQAGTLYMGRNSPSVRTRCCFSSTLYSCNVYFTFRSELLEALTIL